MSNKPKLTYFDASISRGDECRLAFHIAGVDFEDDRIKRADWLALKPNAPFGSLPILTLPGKPPLAQSNAILVLIGRQHGLHPMDDFEAARHESVMHHVEDLRAHLSPSMRMTDEVEKKKAREAILASGYIATWAAHAEKHIAEGPFFAGSKLNVVDLKLYSIVKWLTSGTIDHIPTTVFHGFPKLVRVHDAVREHAAVKAWYANH